MTCSTSIDEMLERPTRMKFIEVEAHAAVIHGLTPDACRWPEDSHERAYWMSVYDKEKPPGCRDRGASIPHQRDAEMASTSTG